MSSPDADMMSALVDRIDRLTAGLEAMATVLGMVAKPSPSAAMPTPGPLAPERWTNGLGEALRLALRRTQEGFAEQLGVSARCVAGWMAKPAGMPQSYLQGQLDAALAAADDAARERFARLVSSYPEPVRDRTRGLVPDRTAGPDIATEGPVPDRTRALVPDRTTGPDISGQDQGSGEA